MFLDLIFGRGFGLHGIVLTEGGRQSPDFISNHHIEYLHSIFILKGKSPSAQTESPELRSSRVNKRERLRPPDRF